jgi:hypothetical protein
LKGPTKHASPIKHFFLARTVTAPLRALESESVRELGAHERSKEEPFAVFGKVLLFLEDIFA